MSTPHYLGRVDASGLGAVSVEVCLNGKVVGHAYGMTEKGATDRAAFIIEALNSHAALKESNAELREALTEIIRRSNMLIHQNRGRWDMTVEHDARSLHVTEGNINIALAVLDQGGAKK